MLDYFDLYLPWCFIQSLCFLNFSLIIFIDKSSSFPILLCPVYWWAVEGIIHFHYCGYFQHLHLIVSSSSHLSTETTYPVFCIAQHFHKNLDPMKHRYFESWQIILTSVFLVVLVFFLLFHLLNMFHSWKPDILYRIVKMEIKSFYAWKWAHFYFCLVFIDGFDLM